MITFYEIHPIIKYLIMIYSFVLVILCANNFIIVLRNINKVLRKIRGVILFLITFIFIGFVFIIYRFSISSEPIKEKYTWVTTIPLWIVLIGLLWLTIVIIYDSFILSKFLKTHLSAMSIKESLDELPTGICYYDDNGTVLLSNSVLNEDVMIIMGHRLLNGKDFWNTLFDDIDNDDFTIQHKDEEAMVIFSSGVVKTFRRYNHNFEEKNIYEIVDSDITEEYRLFKQYENKKEQLQIMNKELKNYGNDVTKLTVEKEILGTKIKIHNDLGKLLLQTKIAIEQDADKTEVISLWKEKMQLISLINADKEKSNRIDDLIKTAGDIGVNVVYEGYIPKTGTIEEKIMSHAIHICLTNTVLHGKGTIMNISSYIEEGVLKIRFTNNGEQCKEEIKEGGGLSSLRTLVEKAKGHMKVTSIPQFELAIDLIHIEDEEENDGR